MYHAIISYTNLNKLFNYSTIDFTAEMLAVSFKTVVDFIHILHFQTFHNIRQGVLIFMNNIY